MLVSLQCDAKNNADRLGRMFAQYLVRMKLRPIDPTDLIAASGGEKTSLACGAARHCDCWPASPTDAFHGLTLRDCRVWR